MRNAGGGLGEGLSCAPPLAQLQSRRQVVLTASSDRGTSLIRKRTLLGSYSSNMPRAAGRPWEGGAVSFERGTPVAIANK